MSAPSASVETVIGRAFELLLAVLTLPSALGNLLIRAVLFPAPRPPALRNPGIERMSRIANVLGVALVVWAAVDGERLGREPFGSALLDAFANAVAGLAVIGVLIVGTAILFVAIARRGHRRAMATRALIPIGALIGYLVILIGSALLAAALVPVAEWVQANIADGFWRGLLAVMVSAVMLYLLSLFVAALAMGTWHGGTQLFRSADAHPLFPVVVGLGMAAVAAALMIWELVSRASEPPDPFGLIVLVSGPTAAVVLCLVEGIWLLLPPRSVRFREVYTGDGRPA